MGTKHGVDAVGGDDNVGFGGGAGGERNPRGVPLLFKSDAAMPSVHSPAGSASAKIATRSARCIPNVAFQPEESVT